MTAGLQLLKDELITPIGKLVVIADPQGCLREVDWSDCEDRMRKLLSQHYGVDGVTLISQTDPFGLTSRLAAYFAGELDAIDDLPTATAGTRFQREVWTALRAIPCGSTVSYGKLAKRLGRSSAVRAVGLANGANPIGVVVPCHRVIGANGSLTGYGGGLHRKQWLLAHERAHTPLSLRPATSSSRDGSINTHRE